MLQAADESNIPFLASGLTFDALLAAVPFVILLLVGLTQLLEGSQVTPLSPEELFHRFLPPHVSGPGDPFGVIESVLVGIARNKGTLSLYAVPAFVWFSTRLFAGTRTALNHVFDVGVRPGRSRHFLISFGKAKARDILMVILTLTLFVVNAMLTAGLSLVQRQEWQSAVTTFFVSNGGRILGELLTICFSVSLFFVVYSYASTRRLPWRTALLAASFSAVMFEIAKRMYAFYLTNFAAIRAASGDAKVGAVVLFVLWIYYTALVFLLGGVVAETWELRRMRQRQRAMME